MNSLEKLEDSEDILLKLCRDMVNVMSVSQDSILDTSIFCVEFDVYVCDVLINCNFVVNYCLIFLCVIFHFLNFSCRPLAMLCGPLTMLCGPLTMLCGPLAMLCVIFMVVSV